MAELSFNGVCYCFAALRLPLPKRAANEAIARVGDIQVSTAARYRATAERLGLLERGREDQVARPRGAATPEDLLLRSTLVRLFRRWQQIEPHPARAIREGKVSLHQLGIHEVSLLQSADAIARHLTRIPEELPPDAALLLELARLWSERLPPSLEPRIWRATDAFELFRSMLSVSAPQPELDVTVTRFVRACASVSNRGLFRIAAVQNAIERHAPYKPFRTEIGYLTMIYDPRPFEGTRHAQSVQKARNIVSAGR